VAVQVFSEAYRGRLAFNGMSRLETWLYRIAVHTAGRVKRKRPLHETLGHETADPAGERHIVELEMRELIARLPATIRAPFVLVKIEGLTHREAAEVLGRKMGTVQSQVFDACRTLRAQLLEEPIPHVSESPKRCVL
jgi:RNA polymerase sigma-70 factor (ECF subfamily)